MSTKLSQMKLSRRNFLKIAGAAGVVAVGGHLLDTYAPWLDYEGQTMNAAKSLEPTAEPSAQMLELVRYATLAASGHNTQPWKFAIQEQAIEIHPDYARRLSVVDPHERELWISLGCALENLLIAAQAVGYSAKVTYPGSADYIHVALAANVPQASPLFDAIPLRQNTRSAYNGQAIARAALEQVQGIALEPGVKLKFVTQPEDFGTVEAYVNQGNLSQYADKAFVNELIAWLRFNKKEALARLDGLYSVCSGNPAVPGWLGKMFVSSTQPQQQADADAKKLRSSAGAVVVAAEQDDPASWVRTGQVYERLALQMTALNIKSAFLNQPIEVSEVRSQFQSAMGLGSYLPQLLVRFGYADSMPRSLRRPVKQVLV